MLGVGVLVARVQAGVDLPLESRIVALRHAVKVDQLLVHVVDDLARYGLLAKEHGASAAVGFRIDPVVGNERQDVFEHRLLAAVVADRGFESCFCHD